MPTPVVSIDKMKVGRKGGRKHWTKDEVERRRKAAAKTTRKKPAKPKMPDWLDDGARAVWKATMKAIKGIEVLDRADADVLATYCDAVARHREAAKKARELMAELPIAAAEVAKVAQAYARLILSYSDKLGLNANSRARLAKKVAEEKKDPNAGLFD